MSKGRYFYCEPVTATTVSREHIRWSDDAAGKFGGGIVGEALCGRSMDRGWDLDTDVEARGVAFRTQAHVNPLCEKCADLWAARVS